MFTYDIEFIKRYRKEIISESVSNAERLLRDGRSLLENKFYSRSVHLFISGFEELSKALLVNDANSIPNESLRILIDHKQKLGKLLDFVSEDMLKDMTERSNKGGDRSHKLK